MPILMSGATSQVKARLQHVDEHIPRDGKLPDGKGLPVRANFDGEPIGKVVGWVDRGDGTVEATLELPAELVSALGSDLAAGLDCTAMYRFEDEGVVVDQIVQISQVGIWQDGERPNSLYGDEVPGERVDG